MSTALKIIVVGIALVIGGCGKGQPSGSPKSGQIVAKVDSEELTIHQVNFALSRMGDITEAQAREAGREALNTLIDQELLARKAVEMKLDRDQQTTLAIENAKRQLLSQAFLEKQLQGLAKPSASEIRDYYSAHPELFEKRRIYQFQELVFESKPEILGGVKDLLGKGKPLPELARWLQAQKIKLNVNESVKAAEQLPIDLLPRVQGLKEGQIIAIPADKAVVVLQLVAARNQPLSEEQAKPSIENFLGNKKRIELAQAEVRKLRGIAKIEYLGAFADAGKPAKPADAGGEAGAQPAPHGPAGAATKTGSDYMEKGLKGL